MIYKEKYEKIWNEIEKYEKITIFTHLNPDGDTIGTSIALKELILNNLACKKVMISGDKYPSNLNWLPQNDDVDDLFIKDSLAILVDTSSIKRCFDKRILNSDKIIKIDHHHPEGNEWFIEVSGDNWPAAGEIIYDMIKTLDLKTNDNIYKSLFVSIWTDTSGLVERNPSKKTFEAIKWLENKGITKDFIINKLKLSNLDQKLIKFYTSNAKIYEELVYKINYGLITNDLYRPATEMFFKKYDATIYIFVAKETKNIFRVGFRSKGFDVSKIAFHFGGGGHLTSAGTKVNTLNEVEEILEYTKELLNEK